MMRVSPILAWCGAALAVGALVVAAPMPTGSAAVWWQLDFEFHDLQQVAVVLPGDERPTTFWYLLYTVTNNTREEVGFYPGVDLVTDSLQVVRAGENIPPRVYEIIKARHEKAYPFFRSPERVSGKLLQGSDNARTSAAVFRDFDPKSSSLTVFAAGLSGEITRLPNPLFDRQKEESDSNPRFFVLRKTLAIRYDLPGDSETRHESMPVRRAQDWVMR